MTQGRSARASIRVPGFSRFQTWTCAFSLSGVLAVESCDSAGSMHENTDALAAKDDACVTVDACMKALVASAEPGSGISMEEQGASAAVRAFGESAIPLLLPLLKHDNQDVRDLASFTIRGMDGLTDQHLDALIEARLNGDGWIPPAIASVGSHRAIEFLVSELKKEKQTGTQLTSAFKVLGEKGVAYLVKEYKCSACDEDFLRVVAYVFSELGEDAAIGVDDLVGIAEDPGRGMAGRRGAVDALGAIGSAARAAVPALKSLAQKDPKNFDDVVNSAIVEIGAPFAVDVLLDRLKKSPSMVVLRDIAALGQKGKQSGPRLLTYLDHQDPEIRLGAARAIGYIGFEKGAARLIGLLEEESDWRLVAVSIEALGRLMAADARGRLTALEQNHWHPAVRSGCRKALEVIAGRSTYVSEYHKKNFAMEFFSYQNIGSDVEPCGKGRDVEKRGNGNDSRLAEDVAKGLQYKTVFESRGPGDDEHPAGGHVDEIPQTPQVGLDVGDGWLVGASRGEWGGELVFLENDKPPRKVLRDNVVGVFELGSDVVVVTGLAHLSTNRGWVYKIARKPSGDWSATKWRSLPGAPRSASIQSDGRLLVCCRGGAVFLSPSGGLETANCDSVQCDEPASGISCGRTEDEIFTVLMENLESLDGCVRREKTRSATALPDVLELEFVIKASGRVVDFRINHGRYRTGPMNNCMIKAFRTISFPATNGSNCPVTIPIKIGG